jgi:hypothetical protein
VQNSPARLPDVGLGPRVGLPGRRQPAGYGTSWSVLVSSTSGRSGPSNRIYFTIFHPRTSHESDVVELLGSHQAMTDAQGFTRAR